MLNMEVEENRDHSEGRGVGRRLVSFSTRKYGLRRKTQQEGHDPGSALNHDQSLRGERKLGLSICRDSPARQNNHTAFSHVGRPWPRETVTRSTPDICAVYSVNTPVMRDPRSPLGHGFRTPLSTRRSRTAASESTASSSGPSLAPCRQHSKHLHSVSIDNQSLRLTSTNSSEAAINAPLFARDIRNSCGRSDVNRKSLQSVYDIRTGDTFQKYVVECVDDDLMGGDYSLLRSLASVLRASLAYHRVSSIENCAPSPDVWPCLSVQAITLARTSASPASALQVPSPRSVS